jgi:hypothetical protein
VRDRLPKIITIEQDSILSCEHKEFIIGHLKKCIFEMQDTIVGFDKLLPGEKNELER